MRRGQITDETSAKKSAQGKYTRPSSSLGRYLMYASGEVILVMVGILLALQVNNWNTNRIEKSREQDILNNLQMDFRNNIENLTKTYTSFNEAYTASVELLDIIQSEDRIDPAKVELLVDNIVNKTQSYDLLTGAINEIFNTGSFRLIKDPILRKQLSNWSYYFSDTEDDVIIYKDYLFDIFIPSLTKKVRWRNSSFPSFFEDDLNLQSISKSNFEVDYNETIRNVEFENEVYNNTLNYAYVINSYLVFQKYLMETLTLIKSNLK